MDVRQQRSQERLFAAALELARDAPVGSMSVSQVARTAGVHRSTFYELATSPADLVQQALLSELDVLRAALLDDGDDSIEVAVTAVTRHVLEHVRRHAAIYRRGLGHDSSVASLHPMLARHFRETSEALSSRVRLRIDVDVPGVPAARVADAALHFVAAATVGAIEAWLETDPLDVEEFLAVYGRLVPSWWPHDAGGDDESARPGRS